MDSKTKTEEKITRDKLTKGQDAYRTSKNVSNKNGVIHNGKLDNLKPTSALEYSSFTGLVSSRDLALRQRLAVSITLEI